MFNLFGSKKSPLQPATDLKEAKKFSFEKYTDPTGEFSSKKLKYSLWYIEHKVILYKIFLVILVVFIIVSWGISFWWWGKYILYGFGEDQNLGRTLANFTNFSNLSSTYKPVPLSIINTYIIPGGTEKYDVVAEVANSNNRFLARFDYHFIIDGVKTLTRQGVLLPGENKFFGHFGLESSVSPGAPVFILENVSWQRISNHDVPDTKLWQEDHLRFLVSDFEFIRTESSEGAAAHIIKFKITNNTPYSYVAPQFYVGLFLQQSLVGVFPVTVNKFKSLETRIIDLRSFVPNLQVSDIQIFPLINIYDPEVYLPPER